MRRPTVILLSVAAAAAILAGLRAGLPWAVERYANRQLATMGEYTGRVTNVDLSILRGAYTLHGITIVKVGSKAESPFLDLEQMDISLQWRALLDRELVGELVMQRPILNLVQGESERDTQLGAGVNWPEQVRRFFPFRFNVVEVHDGRTTFRAPGIEADESLTLESLQVVLRDLTNVNERQSAAFASVDVTGRLMGDAPLRLTGHIDPNESMPTFDMNMSIEGAEVVKANPWLKEFVNADAESGTFSMYAELAAAQGRFEGYVKPIIENPRIFEPDEPASGPFQKAWEGLVEIAARLLTNREENQVATEVPLAGDLENPSADVLTAAVNLFRNAFVTAFSHALEESVGLADVQRDSGRDESSGADSDERDERDPR